MVPLIHEPWEGVRAVSRGACFSAAAYPLLNQRWGKDLVRYVPELTEKSPRIT